MKINRFKCNNYKSIKFLEGNIGELGTTSQSRCWETHYAKGWKVNILGFVSHMVTRTTFNSVLCHKSSHGQYINFGHVQITLLTAAGSVLHQAMVY